LKLTFKLNNIKIAAGERSWLYGGYETKGVLLFVRNFFEYVMGVGGCSWWRNQLCFYQRFGCYCPIASSRCHKMVFLICCWTCTIKTHNAPDLNSCRK